MSSTPGLPNIAEFVAPLLERISPEQRPLLIAIAERMAAQRYRGWAEASEQASLRSELLACADREEEIASQVEAPSSVLPIITSMMRQPSRRALSRRTPTV